MSAIVSVFANACHKLPFLLRQNFPLFEGSLQFCVVDSSPITCQVKLIVGTEHTLRIPLQSEECVKQCIYCGSAQNCSCVEYLIVEGLRCLSEKRSSNV